jgi:multicomponent Na+:H+ antiporter subunit D
MVIPLCVTAAISLLLGLHPQLFHNFVRAFGHF